MFTVCFLSSAVRCQPLSRALCLIGITNFHCFYIQFNVFGYHLEL
ncbi:superoxide dismutase [Vibrio anguillarum]|nr:superoxide dismutase [Vibrio anguillarum]